MKNVIRLCERLAPPGYAMDGDNVGLIIGMPERCTGVLVALDLTEAAVSAAVAAGANLIIVHHPPIYYPLKRLDLAAPQGRVIAAALRAGISVYAMHTNLDFAPQGLNEYVARLAGLRNIRPAAGPGRALYRIGALPRAMSAAAFARQVKARLGVKSVRLYGEEKRMVKRIAVCTGAGADLLPDAAARGADLLLTGEARHHHVIDCTERGACMLDAGHLGTERPMVTLVAEWLKKMMAKTRKGTRITPLLIQEPFSDY